MPSSLRVTRPIWRIVLCAATACCGACRGPASKARIIEEYRAAACVPFSANPTVSPHTREWDTQVTLGDGSKVMVSGSQSRGGKIEVRYLDSGRKTVAADAGDYVYPSDVRLNTQNDRLYVKADGLGGGIKHETWLVEYDLRAQRQMVRQQVVTDALPPECQEPSQSK
jgi:hypothetical protein